MQTKFKKILSGVMSLAMLATFAVPTMVFAAEPVNSVGSVAEDIFNETVVGTDVDQGKTSVYDDFTSAGDEQVDVYVTKASTYSIRIPTTIILNGTANDAGKYVGLYQVSVSGDISGEEAINVVPDETVTLSHSGKDSLVATIDQDKTVWVYADLDVNANGEVAVEGLTAGSWNGSFMFNIAREALASSTTTYTMLNGDGAVINKFAQTTLSMRSSAPVDKFVQVKVNGEVVDPSNYTVSEGSTIITFKPSYVAGLPSSPSQDGPGTDFDVEIESTDGSANGSFTVVNGIPEGAVYISALGDVYTDEVPDTINDDDMFIYGDYQYKYNETYKEVDCSPAGWNVMLFDNEDLAGIIREQLGIEVYTTDRFQTSYDPILGYINGEYIADSLYQTFMSCENMTTIPEIPYGIKHLEATFQGCKSLTDITGFVIPDSVTNMRSTFAICTNLTGTIKINANPTDIRGCFSETTQPIILTGTSTMLAELAATSNAGNVTVGQ